ncbi:programmed cell death protein 2 [Galendromus occidentalis]|uniref:Programmed cell death protein 2 n=1 Tax=Galendromus occidentalis TaxID=34638 RepID=A0AAJ6VVG0_9ACAR|nr:programmed cell death protein 2 [Galendromus occidentalis]
MEEKSKRVELGFAEKTESWRLRSKFFPSKLGGKPAWLALKSLPSLKCSCGDTMSFIMQVYAPVDNHPTCFHRTLFAFGCPPCVDKKKADSIVVFRSQLGLKNEFYPDTPASEVEKGSETPSAEDFNQLCCVCACPASSKCSLCKNRSYCSKQHQVIDWKKAHRSVCAGKKDRNLTGENGSGDGSLESELGTSAGGEAAREISTAQPGVTSDAAFASGDLSKLSLDWGTTRPRIQKEGVEVLQQKSKGAIDHEKNGKKKEKPSKDFVHNGVFPEYEIETETEESDERSETKEDTQQDLVNYLKGMDKESIATMREMASCSDKDLKEIEDMSRSLDDKAFKRFKKIISPYPEQILRYCKGGEPLWVSAEAVPESIPACGKCGSPREYEFQIMPQVLNLLKSDLLDWGTVAVYTCSKNCDTDGYVKEFLHRQDFV